MEWDPRVQQNIYGGGYQGLGQGGWSLKKLQQWYGLTPYGQEAFASSPEGFANLAENFAAGLMRFGLVPAGSGGPCVVRARMCRSFTRAYATLILILVIIVATIFILFVQQNVKNGVAGAGEVSGGGETFIGGSEFVISKV